jgi:hypothetical protein
VTSRERISTKGGSRTRGKTPRSSKPPRRRPSITQQRRRRGFNSLKVALRKRNNTKGSSRPLENNHPQHNKKGGGFDSSKMTPRERNNTNGSSIT